MNHKKTILTHLLRSLGNDPIAIFAGHYALVLDNGIPVPAIYQGVENLELKKSLENHPYAGQFPLETFKFGLDVIESLPKAKLVSLVNDWQMLPKHYSNTSHPHRTQYFKSAITPDIFQDEIKRRNMQATYLEVPERFRSHENVIHFSETRLRNMFDNDSRFNSNCSLNQSCAQEFVPLLHAIYEGGIRELICLIPGTCKEPTLAGTKHVLEIVGLQMTVWNIYLFNTTDKKTFWDGAWLFKNGEHEMSVSNN